MLFERDLSGIDVRLQINGYKHTKNLRDCEWCHCSFSFLSYDWLKYSKENDPMLTSNEVDMLNEMLSKLLNNNLLEETEISFIEPDFIFILYPQQYLPEDIKLKYIASENKIPDIDIYVEWRIYFWDGALTENYLTVTLYREDIISLRDYLSKIVK